MHQCEMDIIKCILVIYLTSFCLAQSKNHRIIGGTETTIEKHPYMAALEHRIIWVYFECGATIISNKHLITAAHCESDSNAALYARVGSTRYDRGGQVLRVGNFVKHPNYTYQSLDYDFAIVYLAEGVEISVGPNVRPVRLASPNEELDQGTPLTAVGWGYTSETTIELEETLREVDLDVVASLGCSAWYPSLSPRQLCAGGTPQGDKNICSGDSGGPGVYNGTLYGIASGVSVYGCEKPHYPAVFAKISSVRDWIDEMTNV